MAGGLWWDVAFIACVLIPAVFALVLIGAAVVDVRAGCSRSGSAFVVLAVVLELVECDVFANFARLGATTLLGWWFLSFFETVSWVVLVAVIIPWVDIVLRVARADEADRRAPRARLLGALVRVPGAR